MQFELYKKQTDAKIKSLETGLEMQKETISILLATYEAHMIQQQSTYNSARIIEEPQVLQVEDAPQSVNNPSNNIGGEWT